MAMKKKATRAAKPASGPRLVNVLVNGETTGTVEEGHYPSIAKAAQDIASKHGLRSFSIKIDGTKLTDKQDVNKALTGAKSIELYAKDSRG